MRVVGDCKGDLEPAEWAKLSASAATLAAMPVWFDSSPVLTGASLKERVRRLRQRLGDDEARIVVFIPDLARLGSADKLWVHGRPFLHTMTALRTVAREVDVAIVAAIRILHDEEYYAVVGDLRRLQSIVDRLAILRPGWAAEDEVSVQIEGRSGGQAFRLRVTDAGTFEDTE